ncbi:sorting nexin-31 isoform X7 [Falco biarmicus]|uniref:sorting nexin-31 isoform X8 n=1 Tax=Falco rusticolus TaxID=120794 RepID=UPI001886A793|nr:sorting nexin-31 isoform X8 [Falco rusticolus]XP_055559968.1 sorting nexin-31 isoform X7 [Falco cherrug]XP_056186567.1 sorting nexin-31 isoform X7 [Falco biarmicus]
MKLHFSITTAEELRERRGGRYVLYSVCLEGFLLGKARYSQLRRWDAQLRQLFGSAVPAFPPKYYLAMTKSMADERQSQLEQYLQNVTLDSNITNSDVFIAFFRKLQQVTLCKMGLSRELTKYFSLFFFQDHDDGVLSVVKKVAEFELPYVSLQSMKVLHCKLGIRKWYMDPSLDTLLMDCRASLNLLYMQAIQEVERNWVKPTEGQMQELELLQKNAHKVKVSLAFTANHSSSIFLLQFLELIREMQFYGYVRLDPCMCDYPEEGCTADVYVGNNEINCCIKLPTNQIKEVSFKINRLRSWQVTFLGATKGGEEDTLEFRFEYNDSGTWQWIILYTKQAFLLSSCLKKMISEHMTKAAREGQEMVVHSGFISRKRFLVRPSEDDRVFEKIGEEDL